MISKNEIKFVRSLHQKKFRDEYSLFIIEGEKMLNEAKTSGFEIVSVYYKDDIGDEEMERISALSSPSPVLAVLKQKKANSLPIPGKGTLSLALDGVRDPGNFGTIIRIADWFGIDNIYASTDSVELYNPKVIQASMGSVFRKDVHYVNLEWLVNKIKGSMPIYGTLLNGNSIYETKLTTSGLIVMGNESNGISPEIEKSVDKRILIPPYPIESKGSESLNVATATAIVCSEFRRASALQLRTK